MLTETVKEFRTQSGYKIFRLPLEAFPGFWVFAYLALADGSIFLIDTGSGFGNSNDHLVRGFQQVSTLLGRELILQDVSDILITHAHIDHFGGLGFVKSHTRARVGVHELDRRVLTNYEERLAVISRKLREFLIEAGVAVDGREKIISMYLFSKGLHHSVEVDFTYEAQDYRYGPFNLFHVPGHSPGHVVIRLEDVLFVGDHVLNEISPHQAPESLTPFTGLDHYLRSLERLGEWAGSIHLALPGHKTAIENLDVRIKEIRAGHGQRLDLLMELLAAPHTTAELSRKLFKEVNGYNVLLALEETGAHMEYLYQRGELGLSNLAEITSQNGPVPIQYVRLYDQGAQISFSDRLSDVRI